MEDEKVAEPNGNKRGWVITADRLHQDFILALFSRGIILIIVLIFGAKALVIQDPVNFTAFKDIALVIIGAVFGVHETRRRNKCEGNK